MRSGQSIHGFREFPDGTQAIADAYCRDWGYYETSVDNIVDFSAWLSEQELSDERVKALKNNDKYTLIILIDEYNRQLEETDE